MFCISIRFAGGKKKSPVTPYTSTYYSYTTYYLLFTTGEPEIYTKENKERNNKSKVNNEKEKNIRLKYKVLCTYTLKHLRQKGDVGERRTGY